MTAVLKVLVGILAATSAVLLYFIIHEFNPFLRRCNPDVCSSYALSAFRVHSSSHSDSSPCQYGSLPGVLSFNVMKPAGSRWQTALPKCHLANLLMPSSEIGDVKVLLLGDSVDAHLTREWCSELEQPLRFTPPASVKGSVASFAAAAKAAATGSGSSSSNASLADADECCKNRDVMYYCRPERRNTAAAAAAAGAGNGSGSISLGMYHILGVHLDGPFHTGAKGNFLTRIPLALKTFEAVHGAPPHLVLLHSNFWDQSRMWEQQQAGYGHLNKLLPDVVFSWSSNFSLMLSTTAELLPEATLMATRTAAFPAFSANWLGRWPYIQQLNMAASEVARLHGVAVVDVAGMVFGLEPRQYLQDQHHPNKVVLLEAANIAMNLLRQHQQQQQQDTGQQQAGDPASKASSTTPDDDDLGADANKDDNTDVAANTGDASSDAGQPEGAADVAEGSAAAAAGPADVKGGGSSAAADRQAQGDSQRAAAPNRSSSNSKTSSGSGGAGDHSDVPQHQQQQQQQQGGVMPAGQQAAGSVNVTRKALNSSQQQAGLPGL
uniref:Uncharacterized protein n=1 Tax=Tetradesmus obliquus TaxID=3088 RepID=A0A383W942_TETOB|eukprot:jgi/Sobl393_1/19497/SZX74157.1